MSTSTPVRRARSIVRLAILFLGCLSVASPTLAQERGPRGDRDGPAGLVARHAEELGLDSATRERIDRIMERSGRRHSQLQEERRDARERLRDLLNADEPIVEDVMRQAQALGSLETELQKNRLDTILQIRGALTPEQRARLSRVRQRERPRGGRRFGVFRRCGRELDEFCPRVAAGAEVLGCLQQNWSRLGERCRDAFDRSAPRRRDSR